MRWILCFICTVKLFASEVECIFTPPKGWELTDPTTLAPHVKIAFFKKSSKGFCPSINLSIEKTDATLSEYLKAVKNIHERDRRNNWRALGKVRTHSGLAQLTEIDSPSDFGSIRILQLILMKEGHAYILTAAALKEEFSEYYQELQRTFRSLNLTTDLLSSVPQLDRRERLKIEQVKLLSAWKAASKKSSAPEKNKKFQNEHWLPFQKLIINQFQDMGAYWQVLLLRSAHEKLSHIISNQKEESAVPIENPEVYRVQLQKWLPCLFPDESPSHLKLSHKQID